jgi:hypothetical protein
LSGEDADALVKTVLAIPDGSGHDLALLKQIAGLLSAHGREFEGNLPEVLDRCLRDARAQLVEEPPRHSDLL